MNNDLKDCLRIIGLEIEEAAMRGKINARPFVDYMDKSAQVFFGMSVLIEMIQLDRLDDEERRMSQVQEDAILTLMRTTASVMTDTAWETQGWAADRLKNEGK